MNHPNDARASYESVPPAGCAPCPSLVTASSNSRVLPRRPRAEVRPPRRPRLGSPPRDELLRLGPQNQSRPALPQSGRPLAGPAHANGTRSSKAICLGATYGPSADGSTTVEAASTPSRTLMDTLECAFADARRGQSLKGWFRASRLPSSRDRASLRRVVAVASTNASTATLDADAAASEKALVWRFPERARS